MTREFDAGLIIRHDESGVRVPMLASIVPPLTWSLSLPGFARSPELRYRVGVFKAAEVVRLAPAGLWN
jgi:hypothetical protein